MEPIVVVLSSSGELEDAVVKLVTPPLSSADDIRAVTGILQGTMQTSKNLEGAVTMLLRQGPFKFCVDMPESADLISFNVHDLADKAAIEYRFYPADGERTFEITGLYSASDGGSWREDVIAKDRDTAERIGRRIMAENEGSEDPSEKDMEDIEIHDVIDVGPGEYATLKDADGPLFDQIERYLSSRDMPESAEEDRAQVESQPEPRV